MMKRLHFSNAEFVKSAVKPPGYPRLSLSEMAVVGRSNVGKSSLINHLMQMKKLAKTSSTPGKTQLINFFRVGEQFAFVDLPGYGYAAAENASWGTMVEAYLKEREELKLVLFLLDIRRTPNAHDLQMGKWLKHHEIPTLFVLTKVDKVRKNERARQTALILKTLACEGHPHVHYSTLKNIGRPELIHEISLCLS